MNTRIFKGRDGWGARTTVEFDPWPSGDVRELRIYTQKASNGGIFTGAQVVTVKNGMMSFVIYGDYMQVHARDKAARCTEKSVTRLYEPKRAAVKRSRMVPAAKEIAPMWIKCQINFHAHARGSVSGVTIHEALSTHEPLWEQAEKAIGLWVHRRNKIFGTKLDTWILVTVFYEVSGFWKIADAKSRNWEGVP